jgi:hypothetical protein
MPGGSVGRRGQFNEFFESQTAPGNHGVEQKRQPHFQTRQAVRHLLEVGIRAGAQFSVSAAIGFISLFGVAVMDGKSRGIKTPRAVGVHAS